MVDWHCHILPSVDDGAADMGQSVAMASALSAAGYDTVYCTPHMMRGSYEVSNEVVRLKTWELQERLEQERIPLKLIPGREYCLDEYLIDLLAEPITLGENRQVLIELLPNSSAEMVRHLMYGVVRAGFVPVVAHPERSPLLEVPVLKKNRRGFLSFFSNMFTGADDEYDGALPESSGNGLLDYLRDLGCCFQGNLGSFSGYYGSKVMAVAQTMKQIGIYDRFGTDLHSPDNVAAILGQNNG